MKGTGVVELVVATKEEVMSSLPLFTLFFFFFFFMNGNTERAQCALSRVCIPYEKEKKAMKRIKKIYKISKMGRKKNAIWSLRWG